MHTGGFHSRRGLATAISQQKMDLISLGKTTCLNPFLGSKILKPLLPQFSCPNPHIPGISLWKFLVPVRIFGASFQTIFSDHQSPIYIIKSTMIETVFKLDCFLWVQLGFVFLRYTWQLHLMVDYQLPDVGNISLGSLMTLLPLRWLSWDIWFQLCLLNTGICSWKGKKNLGLVNTIFDGMKLWWTPPISAHLG